MFCNNCGKEMSEKAEACPDCGHPNKSLVAASPKSKATALLLCFFLGAIGVHRFYVGKVGTGIIQLFTFGGCLIWTTVDFVFIAYGKFTDANGKTLT